MRIARGDVWLTDYGKPLGREQGGVRPSVVLSGAALNDVPVGVVFAVPITGTDRGWPTHVEVDTATAGLVKPSWAMTEQFRATAIRRFQRKLGYVDETFLGRIHVVLQHLLRP